MDIETSKTIRKKFNTKLCRNLRLGVGNAGLRIWPQNSKINFHDATRNFNYSLFLMRFYSNKFTEHLTNKNELLVGC